VVCDLAASVWPPTVQPPWLVHPASKGTTPLQRLVKPDFKDTGEAEKRKIVRENVAQLYGFDFY
jgi:hypothetical protein